MKAHVCDLSVPYDQTNLRRNAIIQSSINNAATLFETSLTRRLDCAIRD